MSGYVPLFQSLTTGTLCGKWPDIGLWPIVLSLSDKNGVVDVTPVYLAGVTGLPLTDVISCMERFCEPDPYSRSAEEKGARLILLHEHRDWGWRVVNHGTYREKARRQFHNQTAVESGANKERLKTRRDQTRPDETVTHTQTQTHTEREVAKPRPARRVPLQFSPDLDYARNVLPDIDADSEAQKFRDWEFKTPRSDWKAAWRNWITRCKETGQYAKKSAGKWY